MGYVFSNTGFTSNDKILTTKVTSGASGLEYSFSRSNITALTKTIKNRTVEKELPSLNDITCLLYNIALGQRMTTPEFANQFIDRHAKTFFREEAKITIELAQESLTNISALSNYIHMSSWNKETGTLEKIYSDYCYILAGLARALKENLKKKKNDVEDTKIINDRKRNNIHVRTLTPRQQTNLVECLKSDDEFLALVEGIMVMCCWRDHSATDKDLHNSKIKQALNTYWKTMSKITIDDEKDFWTKGNINNLKKMGKIARPIWIVKEQTDDVIDILTIA